MNISFRQIELFLALAKALSFSAAAQSCHISQPALSITIKKLEESIGAPLFNRHTRRVTLTAVGVEFYRHAIGLQENIQKSHLDIISFVHGKRGKLTIVASPSIAASLAPKAIHHFLQTHPQIDISLHDETDTKCLEKINNGKADIALIPIREISGDIYKQDLFEDYLVVVYPVGHPLQERQEITWKDIHQYPNIQIRDSVDLRQTIGRELSNIDVKIHPAYEVNLAATMLGMIRSDLGIGILSRSSLTATVTAGLQYRKIHSHNSYRTIAAVSSSRVAPSPLMAPFIGSCKVAASEIYNALA
ncbi:LysR family transcriptional regulator [Achromobacter aegrifaciens]